MPGPLIGPRALVELAALALIERLDSLTDPDLEPGCEDEGFDSDSEPEVGT